MSLLPIYPYLTRFIAPVSIATFFGHVPWLGVYISKIPALTGNLALLLNHCVNFTTARVEKGSEKKDLFHYLVRL